MNAIDARGLTRRYGSVTAVDDVSFSVRAGEIFGFLGPNGAGKSTTVRMLTGYIFVSGVFVPLADLPSWSQWVGFLSPLSYCVDLVRTSLGETGMFPPWASAGALVTFAAAFVALAALLHRRRRQTAS